MAMRESRPGLSARSLVVLEMIAAGSSYEQILAAHRELSYLDIFQAAEEAIGLAVNLPSRQTAHTVAEKRERYPRAYEKWTEKEEITMRKLVRAGMTVARIAGRLQRNRGAIRSRLIKLDLVGELSEREQERLHRIIERRKTWSLK
ncbi:MAG TPA: hypothetical protein VFE58_01315 [Tepidisphaeraceae bacterium]|nr:hypothetical protein [Tepidisphaeraceae bacterium]